MPARELGNKNNTPTYSKADQMAPVLTAVPDTDVEARKTDLLFQNAGLAWVANLINSSLLGCAGLVYGIEIKWVASWFLLLMVVITWRYLMARRFKAETPAPKEYMAWRQRYVRLTAGVAVGWALTCVVFFWKTPEPLRFFSGLVLGGTVAGAISVLAPVVQAYRSYLFIVLLPVIGVLLLQASGFLDWAYLLVCVLFMIVMLRSAHAFHDTLDASIRLEIQQQLLSESLAQARDKAEAGNRAKSEFLANMSHEIRTPLNGVLGMADLLQSTPLTRDQKEYLEVIRSSGKTLLVLLNDILDLSKIEEGKLTLENTAFNIHELIFTSWSFSMSTVHKKGLRMRTLLDQKVPQRLMGDSVRLSQILGNLISNAVKFTNEGEVCLDVSLVSLEDQRCTLHFCVSDTGIGIEPHILPHIFESFTQGDGSITRQYGGTGLGLAICKNLSELMNGQLTVDSTPGQGSRFHFTVSLGVA